MAESLLPANPNDNNIVWLLWGRSDYTDQSEAEQQKYDAHLPGPMTMSVGRWQYLALIGNSRSNVS